MTTARQQHHGAPASPTSPRSRQQNTSRISVSIFGLVVLVILSQTISIWKTSAGCSIGGGFSSSSFADEVSASFQSRTSSSTTTTTTSLSINDNAQVTVIDKDAAKWKSISQNNSIAFRVYRAWDYNEAPFPCVHSENKWKEVHIQRSPSSEGLLFIRNMKTGSSTVGGITIRIGKAMAKRTNLTYPSSRHFTNDLCRVRFDHTPASYLNYKNRNKKKSFLFSFIRDPTKRVTSEFFHFGVSRFKREPSEYAFKHYILSKSHLHNYFLFDMSLDHFNGTKADWPKKQETALDILNNYDFIGLTERMDESLVVMKILLGVKLQDILYLKAKGKGSFDDGAFGGKCYYIVSPYVSPAMEDFFNGPIWNEWSDGDYFLYNMAAKSLDKTIDEIGRERVEREVALFRGLKEVATERCLPTTTFPCTPEGVFHKEDHDCYWWDSGCGYKCMDEMDHDAILAELEAKLDGEQAR